MKKEELLKSISNLLKKHEDFLNENPEVFYAIEDRFFKAVNDEDYIDDGSPDLYDDEEDYGQGQGYGDEVFDRVPSEDPGKEQDSEQDGGELDEADQWLQEQDAEREARGETGDYSDPSETGTVQQQEEIQAEPEQVADTATEQPQSKKLSPYDWKPQAEYHPDHTTKMKEFADQGYSERESERMAGAHDAPASFYDALNRRVNPSDPSPKMLEEMKGISKKWLSDARKNTNYDAAKNPILNASSKTLRAHEEAHGGFNESYNEFLHSDDLKGLKGRERHNAIKEFKNNYKSDNPDYQGNAIAAAGSGTAYSEADEARKQELMNGLESILGAGQMHVDDSDAGKGYSQEVAGLGDGKVSDQAAAQMVGAAQGDQGFQANIKKDPALHFAETKDPAVMDQLKTMKEKLAGKLNPEQTSRMSAIDSLKPKKAEQPKQETPRATVKTLDDKGLQHINDHLIEYAPLINIKGKTLGRNLPDHIDDGDLLVAGMHGLVDAFHTYDASKGATFKSHAGRRIEGKMRDYISAGGPNSVDKFFYDTARKVMGNNKAISQPADTTASAIATPTEIKTNEGSR